MTYRQIHEEAGPDWPHVEIVFTGGPSRVHYDDHPDPTYRPRPAGFTTNHHEHDPILWEGDNA